MVYFQKPGKKIQEGNMGKKKVYETPRIIDLNGFSASGQDFEAQGMCEGGGSLTFGTCADGVDPSPGIGNCAPVGSGVEAFYSCSPTGVAPYYGYCTPNGNSAVEGCNSGGVHA